MAFKKNFLQFLIFILILTVFICFLITYELKKIEIISTKTGKIIGTSVNRFQKKVNCFFGIPFAEPPIGPLRWKRPVPKKPWTGTLLATNPPNYCWQSSDDNPKDNIHALRVKKYVPDWDHFYGNHRSEDCLYLNIFKPRGQKNMTTMVWIHGGSFQSGSPTEFYYDGSILAAKTGVIVVSISYRLGIFGYLLAEDTELNGNYGLHDQRMALQWIQENIQQFGGNPEKIVLFGESAGAISVGYHVISAKSQNLFSRAILQSGNPLIPLTMAGKVSQTKATEDLIRETNCIRESNESSIECLRTLNSSFLFDLSQIIATKRIGAFWPNEDNDFIPETPLEYIKTNKLLANKEIMIGTNAAEGAYFSAVGPFSKFWSMNEIDERFTKETVIETLNKSVPIEYKQYLETAIDYLLEGVKNHSNPVEVWNRYVQFVGDVIFVCSDHTFITSYSANQSVFYYQFRPKWTYNSWAPKWATGAVHAEEFVFVFGIPLILQSGYTLREIELSERIVTVWTNFAKTGKPSLDGYQPWIHYTPEEPLYMSFDVKDIHLNKGFPAVKCDQYYDLLMTAVRKQLKKDPDFANHLNSN